MSEGDDVVKAQTGDTRAMERLLAGRLPEIAAMLRRLLPSQAVDDVMQDVCLNALVAIGGLNKPELFGSWLRTVAYNRAMQWQRKRYRETLLRLRLVGPEPTDSPGDRTAERLDVVNALGLLAPIDRKVIILHYGAGRTSAEIAKSLGLPAGTVRWRLHQTRNAVRRILDYLRD